MRLLFDAHVSGKRVGAALRERGHDVRAVDEEQALEGCSDADLLDLAAQEGRILVTCNVRDFVPLIVERASLGHDHGGVLLVPRSIRHQEFGVLISGVEGTLMNTAQQDWVNRVEWVQRG